MQIPQTALPRPIFIELPPPEERRSLPARILLAVGLIFATPFALCFCQMNWLDRQWTIITQGYLPPAEPLKEKLCKDPYKLYKEIVQAKQKRPHSHLPHLGLSFLGLCPCKKVTPNMRVALEEQCMELLKANHNGPRISLVSVGAGLLYQELVYITKLAAAGYTQIDCILIDINHPPAGILMQICEDILPPTCTVNITYYNNLDNYAATPSPIDLLLLIDLDDPQFYVNNIPLPQHTLTLLQNHLQPNSIIASSSYPFGVKATLHRDS